MYLQGIGNNICKQGQKPGTLQFLPLLRKSNESSATVQVMLQLQQQVLQFLPKDFFACEESAILQEKENKGSKQNKIHQGIY